MSVIFASGSTLEWEHFLGEQFRAMRIRAGAHVGALGEYGLLNPGTDAHGAELLP